MSPGSYFHIFWTLTGLARGFGRWELLDWNYSPPPVNVPLWRAGWKVQLGARGEWEQKATNSPAPSLQGRTYYEDFKKWAKTPPLSYFWQMMHSLNVSYTWALQTDCSTGKYETEVKDRPCWNWPRFNSHWLCFWPAGWPCHVRENLWVLAFQLQNVDNFASFWELNEITYMKYLG